MESTEKQKNNLIELEYIYKPGRKNRFTSQCVLHHCSDFIHGLFLYVIHWPHRWGWTCMVDKQQWRGSTSRGFGWEPCHPPLLSHLSPGFCGVEDYLRDFLLCLANQMMWSQWCVSEHLQSSVWLRQAEWFSNILFVCLFVFKWHTAGFPPYSQTANLFCVSAWIIDSLPTWQSSFLSLLYLPFPFFLSASKRLSFACRTRSVIKATPGK